MPKRLDQRPAPRDQLAHFTNREDELAAFERLVRLEDAPLPVLMFYGVAGDGKSWLIRRLWQALGDLVPHALLDLDRRQGGAHYHTDPSAALAAVRRQFVNVPCPQFDTAYAWIRFHEGDTGQPQFRGSGAAVNVWEAIHQAGAALVADIPFGNLGVWFTDKLGRATWKKLSGSRLVQWLQCKTGQEDYIELSGMPASDIHTQLARRLLEDLREHLPKREGSVCRGVIFLDTFESLGDFLDTEAQRISREQWVIDLYAEDSPLLLVIAGRDKLRWDRVDPGFADRRFLEDHPVGGLAEADARVFLTRCAVEDPVLQRALLNVCEVPGESPTQPAAFHPFSLGLCVDTVHAERERGIETVPAAFKALRGSDALALSRRFLLSLGKGAHEKWVKCLALPLRFDEVAARAMFGGPGAEQDAAWEKLLSYSFLREEEGTSWRMLHARMRDALNACQTGVPQEDDLVTSMSDEMRSWHVRWKEHWEARSQHESDEFAALSFFHSFLLEPFSAWRDWQRRIRSAREEGDMRRHWALLKWWDALDILYVPDRSRRLMGVVPFRMASIAGEYLSASLGQRGQNIAYSIALYEAALPALEGAVPEEWAMAQSNLAVAYQELPTGDPARNLERSIRASTAALRVYSEALHPEEWARTQINLAAALLNGPAGDRAQNLEKSIEASAAALRVTSQTDDPEQWANLHMNLGIAYVKMDGDGTRKNILEAKEAFEAALTVGKRIPPALRVKAAQNLANVLCVASVAFRADQREELIRRAITLLEMGLDVVTEEDFPRDWAGIQLSLGQNYALLARGEGAEHLHNAIEAFENALRFLNDVDDPAAWVRAQHCLGEAYMDLPSGDRSRHLEKAIVSFEAALRVATEENEAAVRRLALGRLAQAMAMLDRLDS